MTPSDHVTALDRLRSRCTFEDVSTIKPFFFALDGGGRTLIYELIDSTDAKVMIEIGCFLNGSVRQWLDHKPDLVVIGVDPWNFKFDVFLNRYKELPTFKPCFARIPDVEEFIASVAEHGPYKSALANVKQYGNRFIPVRGTSPEALSIISECGVVPDIVYIDANKVSTDIEAAFSLWPTARLCGDDWSWGVDRGFPMRTAVQDFAAKNNMVITAERATWLLQAKWNS